MTASKRSKVEIYSDILNSLRAELAKSGVASPTRVAHRANLPYDRFVKATDRLVDTGLILRTDEGIAITDKGLRCLDEMRKTNVFLRKMGLLT